MLLIPWHHELQIFTSFPDASQRIPEDLHHVKKYALCWIGVLSFIKQRNLTVCDVAFQNLRHSGNFPEDLHHIFKNDVDLMSHATFFGPLLPERLSQKNDGIFVYAKRSLGSNNQMINKSTRDS